MNLNHSKVFVNLESVSVKVRTEKVYEITYLLKNFDLEYSTYVLNY